MGLLAGGEELLRLGVAGLVLAEDDADEVVGAGLVVALLHLRGDLVVGLGDDVLHVDAGGVVAEGAEGIDAGHVGVGLLEVSDLIVRGGEPWIGLVGWAGRNEESRAASNDYSGVGLKGGDDAILVGGIPGCETWEGGGIMPIVPRVE